MLWYPPAGTARPPVPAREATENTPGTTWAFAEVLRANGVIGLASAVGWISAEPVEVARSRRKNDDLWRAGGADRIKAVASELARGGVADFDGGAAGALKMADDGTSGNAGAGTRDKTDDGMSGNAGAGTRDKPDDGMSGNAGAGTRGSAARRTSRWVRRGMYWWARTGTFSWAGVRTSRPTADVLGEKLARAL